MQNNQKSRLKKKPLKKSYIKFQMTKRKYQKTKKRRKKKKQTLLMKNKWKLKNKWKSKNKKLKILMKSQLNIPKL